MSHATTTTEDPRTALLLHEQAERRRIELEAQTEAEIAAVRAFLDSITEPDDE